MKDLDFDELDKAVNSLMSKTDVSSSEQSVPVTSTPRPLSPIATPSSSVANSSTSSIPISHSDDTALPNLTPGVAPAVASTTRPLVKPPVTSFMPSSERATLRPTVPVKRNGRFMDLVPAGAASQSPMKSASPRQGTTLSPLSDNVAPEAPASVSMTPTSVALTEAPQQPTQPNRELSRPMPQRSVSPLAASMAMNIRSEHDDMPDPLDLHEQREEDEPEVSPVVQETEVRSLYDQPAPVSPFLSDAKVDKRPLGASAATIPTESAPDPQQPSNQVVPAELQTDLLKIESDLSTESTASTPTPTQYQDSSQLSSPISIAQQYKQQPRTGDQSHAPVYDTAAHPVAHPEKKKSHLLIVMAIATIVVIVVGGVAALFSLGYI